MSRIDSDVEVADGMLKMSHTDGDVLMWPGKAVFLDLLNINRGLVNLRDGTTSGNPLENANATSKVLLWSLKNDLLTKRLRDYQTFAFHAMVLEPLSQSLSGHVKTRKEVIELLCSEFNREICPGL